MHKRSERSLNADLRDPGNRRFLKEYAGRYLVALTKQNEAVPAAHWMHVDRRGGNLL